MSFSEESLDKVPDSLVYTLKSFKLMFLLGASCICLLWKSEKMEASEEKYFYALTIFFFWLNICSCLRVSANITGSRSYFLAGVLPNITSQGTVKRKNSCEGMSTYCMQLVSMIFCFRIGNCSRRRLEVPKGSLGKSENSKKFVKNAK